MVRAVAATRGSLEADLWEEVLEDPRTIYPITAYEIPPFQGRPRR
jgi:hypothetical protein